MKMCKCGAVATEVCYRRGSKDEVWLCTARKHSAETRELAAHGWLTQSAAVASSATGIAIRNHLKGNAR